MLKLKTFCRKILINGTLTALKWLRFFPLPVIHALGTTLGIINYGFNKRTGNHIRNNLNQCGLFIQPAAFKKIVFNSTIENGKGALETFAIWLKPQADVLKWVNDVIGWESVEKALSSGNGVIFLTPHLGCFEITALYYGAQHPITVLYRQPRQSWLVPLIIKGRQRGKTTLAPANSQGVKQLLQALKRGEAIGILPDQAPLEGEGEWADFFNKPAYTMTLASKLAKKTGAQVFMAFGERLSKGCGFNIHINAIEPGGINTPALLNAEIEKIIRQCPEQYLWMYDRYKVRNQISAAPKI